MKNSIDTARDEGKLEGKNETALKMLDDGMSIDIVCKYTGLSKEQVKEIMKKLNND
jgi:predicted transposase/invertase (TIGR01784 family)